MRNEWNIRTKLVYNQVMLKQLFVKDYKDTQNPKVRGRYADVAGAYGVATNLVLGLTKLFVGTVSHSVSIMADAANSLSDCATSVLTIIGFRLAGKKPDHEHPYGHARYEYVAGFVIALFMLAMGCVFAKESISKIIAPQDLVISPLTYVMLFLAILGKVSQAFVYNDFARAIGSKTLEANAQDTKNDIVSSSAIFVAMVVMGVFNVNVDGYLGLAVSVFVIVSSIRTLGEELEPIIGIVPTPQRVKEITDALKSYDVVIGIHDLAIHNYGVHNDFVTVHVEVDASMSMLEAHDKVDNIERDFKNKMGISLTIHMDPVIIGDPKLDALKKQVADALAKLDPTLHFHDIRMVDGPSHTNVVLDCEVPQDKDYTDTFIADYLDKTVKAENPLYFIVEIDRPLC